LGSGAILREVMRAGELLKEDFGITADLWSVTSFSELRREGESKQRWNLLHPDRKPKISYVEQCLAGTQGPVVAVSDYMKLVADQIRPFVPRRYAVLGTDGYGRSDTRKELRRFFEVNAHYIVLAALKAMEEEGVVNVETVNQAISKYGIDPDKPDPVSL
jgi:pyruvate dehydrogenase E1 component